MADWRWEADPDSLLDDLAICGRGEVARLAEEIAARESMVFLEGAAFTGRNPGVRTEARGRLLMTYLTDIRGERIVVIQVTWFD